MSNTKMLIDATHPEETRVVVLRNGRVEEFDYESAARKLLRGNIYLAKVTRVEPSLQAAFVDYGGNRHGFLAFNEIHPDYYQIPMADRQALLDEEAAEEAREEAEADARAERMSRSRSQQREQTAEDAPADDASAAEGGAEFVDDNGADSELEQPAYGDDAEGADNSDGADDLGDDIEEPTPARTMAERGAPDDNLSEPVDEQAGEPPFDGTDSIEDPSSVATFEFDSEGPSAETFQDNTEAGEHSDDPDAPSSPAVEAEPVERTGSEDALEELPSRPRRHRRSYKIQEVIKRRQVILIQIVKEERGNKGAALTTYLSLAGRYTVLMPNTARGGGISRKITNPQDRKRLKAIANELEVPEGMGLIIRTAGAARTKQEIKRDFEYLLRLWESVRDLTLASSAPSLVYEEGNLIKRSIRDLYNKDVEEIVVAGDHAHRDAKDFMRMLMPSHAKNVVLHQDHEPLFLRHGIERQLNAMFNPYVTLRSGGYLVINQTEALVAVDVNSGKATREFSIEETALNTNLEAADEIARQLKLRDLAGLIVIDYIDMEEKRNNRAVERRLKDALRFDRARIQLGHISHFGLMEMSRQRLRSGVLEGSTSQCPHCQGTGIIRSTESVALAVLRGLEDALMAGPRASLVATTTSSVALYILNNKRHFINDMETRYGVSVIVQASDKLQGANFTVEKGHAPVQPARRPDRSAVNMDWGFEGDSEQAPEELDAAPEAERDEAKPSRTYEGRGEEEGGNGRGRRRRRGRRGSRDRSEHAERRPQGEGDYRSSSADQPQDNDREGADLESSSYTDQPDGDFGEAGTPGSQREFSGPRAEGDERQEGGGRRRRRGRRGGRRGRERSNGHDRPDVAASDSRSEDAADQAGHDERDESQEVSSSPIEQHSPAEAEATTEPRGGRRRPRTQVASDSAQTVQEAETGAPENSSAAPSRRKPRQPPSSSEPKIERVVVGPDLSAETAADSGADTGSAPVRKGWWQRTLGGS